MQKIGRTQKLKLEQKLWTVPLSSVLATGTFLTIESTPSGTVYVIPSEDEIKSRAQANKQLYDAKDAFAENVASLMPSLALPQVPCSLNLLLCIFLC